MDRDDEISRQAAIKAALEYLVEYFGAALDTDLQYGMSQKINELPSVQPEWKWIHCDERLPDEDGSYAVMFEFGGKEKGNKSRHKKTVFIETSYFQTERKTRYGTHEAYFAEGKPVAWLPLPEPPKEGDQDG